MKASDTSAFDDHLTDPARLSREVRTDLGVDPAYATPKPGDIRLIYDPRRGKPIPVKVKGVYGDHFVATEDGGEAVQAVWDPRNKRWMRYGRIDV